MEKNSKEKNGASNIIRIRPRRKKLPFSSIIIFLVMSFLLTIGINSFLNFNSKGEEIPLSELVVLYL